MYMYVICYLLQPPSYPLNYYGPLEVRAGQLLYPDATRTSSRALYIEAGDFHAVVMREAIYVCKYMYTV